MNKDGETENILRYLKDRMPGYPYDEHKDILFVEQLLEDFPYVEPLTELKSFRVWLLDWDGKKPKHFRTTLLRWFRRASEYNSHR